MDEINRSRNIKIKFRTSLILFLFSAVFNIAHAEYRAYQYLITHHATGEQSTILSAFNPNAYKAYHGGSESIKIETLNTWICLGYTGAKRDICPAPLQKLTSAEVLP